MAKAYLTSALMLLVYVCSYFGMTRGWGLEVKSWGWFLGMAFCGLVVACLLQLASKIKDAD